MNIATQGMIGIKLIFKGQKCKHHAKETFGSIPGFQNPIFKFSETIAGLGLHKLTWAK